MQPNAYQVIPDRVSSPLPIFEPEPAVGEGEILVVRGCEPDPVKAVACRNARVVGHQNSVVKNKAGIHDRGIHQQQPSGQQNRGCNRPVCPGPIALRRRVAGTARRRRRLRLSFSATALAHRPRCLRASRRAGMLGQPRIRLFGHVRNVPHGHDAIVQRIFNGFAC